MRNIITLQQQVYPLIHTIFHWQPAPTTTVDTLNIGTSLPLVTKALPNSCATVPPPPAHWSVSSPRASQPPPPSQVYKASASPPMPLSNLQVSSTLTSPMSGVSFLTFGAKDVGGRSYTGPQYPGFRYLYPVTYGNDPPTLLCLHVDSAISAAVRPLPFSWFASSASGNVSSRIFYGHDLSAKRGHVDDALPSELASVNPTPPGAERRKRKVGRWIWERARSAIQAASGGVRVPHCRCDQAAVTTPVGEIRLAEGQRRR